MLVEHARIVARALARGVGVHLTADGIHMLGQLRSGVLRRPLEEHVLDEVRAAGVARRFVARADADPHADGRRAHVRHMLIDHAHAVRQRSFFVHDVLCPPEKAGGVSCTPPAQLC